MAASLAEQLEVFASPDKHYRMKCRFGIVHDRCTGDMVRIRLYAHAHTHTHTNTHTRTHTAPDPTKQALTREPPPPLPKIYRMWDNGKLGVPLECFPLADRRIFTGMRVLRRLLNAPQSPYRGPCSLHGLRSITFLASLAGDLIVSMSFKPDYSDEYWTGIAAAAAATAAAVAGSTDAGTDTGTGTGAVLDEKWLCVARTLHAALEAELTSEAESWTQCRSVSLIGRAKGEKVVFGNDYVTEEFGNVTPAPVPGRSSGDSSSSSSSSSSGNISSSSRTMTNLTYKQIEEGFSNPNGTVNRLSLTWLMSVIQNVPELGKTDLLEMYCGNGKHAFSLTLVLVLSSTESLSLCQQRSTASSSIAMMTFSS